MVRTVRRARGGGARDPRAPKVKRRPSRRATPPRDGTAEQRFDDLMALRGRSWVRIAARCERCGARYSACLNTGAETSTPPGPECPTGSECLWRPGALLVDKGDKPWIVDMPGTYGPGDVFEAEAGDRVFIGGKVVAGEWRTVPPGVWRVQSDATLAPASLDEEVPRGAR